MSRFATALALYLAAAVLPGMGTAQTLVIEGATVHPVTAEPLLGRVVVADGLIVAVGPDAEAPAGAARIDATGLHVYPGLCDALSQLGLLEVGSIRATDDRSELGLYNPHLRAVTAIHPASDLIPVTRANGITHTVVAPQADQEGVIAGQAALVHLDGWTVEEMVLDSSIAMVVRWPEIVTRRFDFSTYSMRETPYKDAKEKAEEQQNELRQWIEAARHYAQAAAAESARLGRDLKLEALARILDGGLPVIVFAQAKRDIEAAVAFAEDEGLRMILAGGREAWKLKDLLAEKGIPVILGPTQTLPTEEDDPYDRSFRGPAELTAAGVQIAIGSGAGRAYGPGGPHGARSVPYEAATAAAFGLSEGEALKALTLNPAEIFGVGDRLGSIEPGKVANLIVTDGSPLEITTQVLHLIIQGREVSTANRHRSLYERYRSR